MKVRHIKHTLRVIRRRVRRFDSKTGKGTPQFRQIRT